MPVRTSRSRCRGGRSNRASSGSRATRFGSPAVPVAKARAVDRVPAGRWLRWSRTRERDGNDADADADRVPVRRDRGAAMGGGTAGPERAQVVRFQDRATDRGGLPGGDMNPGAISGNPAESRGIPRNPQVASICMPGVTLSGIFPQERRARTLAAFEDVRIRYPQQHSGARRRSSDDQPIIQARKGLHGAPGRGRIRRGFTGRSPAWTAARTFGHDGPVRQTSANRLTVGAADQSFERTRSRRTGPRSAGAEG